MEEVMCMHGNFEFLFIAIHPNFQAFARQNYGKPSCRGWYCIAMSANKYCVSFGHLQGTRKPKYLSAMLHRCFSLRYCGHLEGYVL
jgi:hypothetical protein